MSNSNSILLPMALIAILLVICWSLFHEPYDINSDAAKKEMEKIEEQIKNDSIFFDTITIK